MDEIINKILEDYGEEGNLKFYMKLAWKESQKELLNNLIEVYEDDSKDCLFREIINKLRELNGE